MPQVFFLSGDEYRVKKSLKKLLSQCKDADIVTKRGDEVDTQWIYQSICTCSMFGGGRVLILEGEPKYDKNFDIVFNEIPDDNVLVITSHAGKETKLYKKIEKVGKARVFKTYTDSEVVSLVSKCFKEREKEINPALCNKIVEYVGQKPYLLESEVGKICNYAGKKKTIESEHIDAVCSEYPGFVTWNLIDALSYRNFPKAVEVFEEADASGEDFLKLIALITWHFRLMFLLKEEIAVRKTSYKDMIKNIGKIKKANGSQMY